MSFDVLLTNPPFAGEIRDQGILSRYELARKGRGTYGRTEAKVERDVLFIERCLHLLKPGGRMAIVLPQGKLNNSTLAYIREWILRHARLLAAVGLHPNTFKPHTGTKTSILFLQKYTDEDLSRIQTIEDNARAKCPDYGTMLRKLISKYPEGKNLTEEDLSEEVVELLHEWFDAPEEAESEDKEGTVTDPDIETLEAELAEREKVVANLRTAFHKATDAKDKEKQKRHKAQIREALAARKEAQELFAKAKRRVEELIEQEAKA